MNDKDTIESALQMLECAPKEVKLGAVGVVGVALIAHYLNNKRGVVNMLARGEFAVNSIYSFFQSKKRDDALETNRVIEEFNQLIVDQRSEVRELQVAILNKQATHYDPNVVNFLENLQVEITNYPELPYGVFLSAGEVKQVIKAREDHHAKVLLSISHYLESTPVDECAQSKIVTQEIK